MFKNHSPYLLIIVLLILFTACTPASTQESSAPTSIPPTSVPPTSTDVPSTPTPTVVLTVTTTLDGLSSLPQRIQWEAKPIDPDHQVTGINFLIDNQRAWVEHKAPYVYGGDGNYLVTSFLTPGEHSFVVRMFTIKGQKIDSTPVKASVSAAPVPPNEFANTSWTRDVTKEDVKKATSSEPPPSGQWGLTMNSVGWMLHDPDGGGLLFDVSYQSAGVVELRAAIEKPPYPSNTGGAFCEEPDLPILWAYAIDDGGKTLTLHPVDKDSCGDRTAILKGMWTLAGE
jgi:hypothetical protein